MAKFICEFKGVRGRILKLYDTKCVIVTKKTAGSLLTGNYTDGEKTVFFTDVVGVQFKESGALIGYLQLETSSLQMNNKSSNFFSENTFTFEEGKNGITNELMRAVYDYIVDRIEEVKFGTKIIDEIPDFEAMKNIQHQQDDGSDDEGYDFDEYIDVTCPNCEETLTFLRGDTDAVCPWCNAKIDLGKN